MFKTKKISGLSSLDKKSVNETFVEGGKKMKKFFGLFGEKIFGFWKKLLIGFAFVLCIVLVASFAFPNVIQKGFGLLAVTLLMVALFLFLVKDKNTEKKAVQELSKQKAAELEKVRQENEAKIENLKQEIERLQNMSASIKELSDEQEHIFLSSGINDLDDFRKRLGAKDTVTKGHAFWKKEVGTTYQEAVVQIRHSFIAKYGIKYRDVIFSLNEKTINIRGINPVYLGRSDNDTKIERAEIQTIFIPNDKSKTPTSITSVQMNTNEHIDEANRSYIKKFEYGAIPNWVTKQVTKNAKSHFEKLFGAFGFAVTFNDMTGGGVHLEELLSQISEMENSVEENIACLKLAA